MTGAVQGRPRAGYLAGVRDVTCTASHLDKIQSDLTIQAEKLMGDGGSVIYEFEVGADGASILRGRATVVLDAEKVGA